MELFGYFFQQVKSFLLYGLSLSAFSTREQRGIRLYIALEEDSLDENFLVFSKEEIIE